MITKEFSACQSINSHKNYIALQIQKVISKNCSDVHVMSLFHRCIYVFRMSRISEWFLENLYVLLQWFDNFLGWLSNWEKEVQSKADMTADEMERCLLSKATRDGWRITCKFIWL